MTVVIHSNEQTKVKKDVYLLCRIDESPNHPRFPSPAATGEETKDRIHGIDSRQGIQETASDLGIAGEYEYAIERSQKIAVGLRSLLMLTSLPHTKEENISVQYNDDSSL